jgi:pimeloyl-ACP methyl ester carboxylesterase
MLPYRGPGSRELSPAEHALLAEREAWLRAEGGYSHIQGTKPQTLAYGLNDSPAGLAAWIVEKFRTWSDCGGEVERCFTKDELLTTITIYWVTQTINSSTRLYYESQHHPWRLQSGDHIQVPCAVALFPKDLSHPPREWAERSYNVQRWTEMPRGGHFAALEEPDLLVEDMRAFFRTLR